MCETPKVYSHDVVKARKEHKCCECRGTIRKGENYHRFQGLWDSWQTYKTCEDCQELRADIDKTVKHAEDRSPFCDLYESVFEGRERKDWILRFMATRRHRNAPPSIRNWMEDAEKEILENE